MKLEIKNIKKIYGERKILDNISFSFGEKTFYTICGDSGCGKTTLLNIISSLDNSYSGNVYYGTKSLENLKDEEKRYERANNIGFVFQSYNLFENDTVFNNVFLMVDSQSHFSYQNKKRKVEELLKIVDLLFAKEKIVKNLSGGEKQRVAIARALANSPKFLFCDEPTGSLDSINSESIFNLLKKISNVCTVICATHDILLAEKYSDYSLFLKDAQIEKVIDNNNFINKKDKMLMMKEEKKRIKSYLSFKFIFRHILNLIKQKKFRYIISTCLLSLSFFSIGLSSYLKEGISTSLKESFSEIIDDNTIIVKKKNSSNSLLDYYSASYNDVNLIEKDYKSDVEYVGVNYLVNFENFFKNSNTLYCLNRPNKYRFDGFNMRAINEYNLVNNFKNEDIYPLLNNSLNTDEIVLSFDYVTMKSLCSYLQIVRTFESLGEYIENNKLLVQFEVKNDDWGYFDVMQFRVRAVIKSTTNSIYHTTKLFNEYVFEDELMFPSSLDINREEKLPWIMKKIYYLKTVNFPSSFLNKITYDKNYSNYLFDNDRYEYSPKTCNLDTVNYTNKIYCFITIKNGINPQIPLEIEKYFNLSNFYYSTNSGYINLGTSLFSGFSVPTFFSMDINKINNVIDAYYKVEKEDYGAIDIGEDIGEGNAMKFGDNIVKFSSLYNNSIIGNYPHKYNEIAISEGLRSILGKDINVGDEMYVSTIVRQIYKDDKYQNYFKTIKLRISGFVKTNKVLIFNEPDFSIVLFRDLFQISSFSLLPNALVYEFSEKPSDELIEKLSSSFIEYEFNNPLEGIESGINSTLGYLNYVLYALSIITIVSSIILLIIINYINIDDLKRDYSILSALGFSRDEILKMHLMNTLLPCLVSLIISFINLLLTNNLLSEMFTSQLGLTTNISINLVTIGLPFIIMILVVIICMEFSKKPINSINISKELH
ncbi:MAG: ABC transporter ATP-binding protein/permease [Bacilli bacterium]